MRVLSSLYGELAWQRRRWYIRHPEARRRLARPVISVGNLSVGGSGKTPIVRHLAGVLLTMGERPAILSRGYARRLVTDGVLVVRDAERIHADLNSAGDEPLMLARALAGAVVIVGADRYLAGRLAEARLGCSVHVLDDGFQHLALARDVDLLVIAPDEIDRPRVLPAGRLRERLEAASFADAALVSARNEEVVRAVAARLGTRRGFRVQRAVGPPRLLEPFGQPAAVEPHTRVVAVAGIAQPQRFFDDLRAAGMQLVATRAFRDHHPFSRRDVEALARHVREARADLVLTTEKDVMRLMPLRPMPLPLAWVPLEVSVEPGAEFRAWIADRLAAARERRAIHERWGSEPEKDWRPGIEEGLRTEGL